MSRKTRTQKYFKQETECDCAEATTAEVTSEKALRASFDLATRRPVVTLVREGGAGATLRARRQKERVHTTLPRTLAVNTGLKEGFLFPREEGLQPVWAGKEPPGRERLERKKGKERRFPKEEKEIQSPSVVAQFFGGRGSKSGPVLDSGGSKQLPTLPTARMSHWGGKSPKWQSGKGSWARTFLRITEGCARTPCSEQG